MDPDIQKVNSLNPPDSRFIDRIKDLERNQYEQQTARQPYLGDWFELNQTDYSIDTASSGNPNLGILACPNYDPQSRHSLGDRVRLKQGGAYKYFYVTDMASDTISLTGDRTAVLTATTPTDIAISKEFLPVGFPSSVTVRVDASMSGTGAFDITYLDVEMFMTGAVVRFVKQLSATVSSAANTVYVKLPVERAQAYMNPIRNFGAWYCNDSGTQTIGYPTFEEPFGGAANTIGIYKWDATQWSVSGGQTLYLNIDYDYIISLTS